MVAVGRLFDQSFFGGFDVNACQQLFHVSSVNELLFLHIPIFCWTEFTLDMEFHPLLFDFEVDNLLAPVTVV